MTKPLDIKVIEQQFEGLTADYRIERVQAVANYVPALIAQVRELEAELDRAIRHETLEMACANVRRDRIDKGKE